jgi:hypothetical protein
MKRRSDVASVGSTNAAIVVAAIAVASAGPAPLRSGMLRACASC